MLRAPDTPTRFERRAKARVSARFWAAVQGTDRRGDHFEAATFLDNLSPVGLYFRLGRDVAVGSRLLIYVHMSRGEGPPAGEGFVLEVYGLVRRVEPLPGGDVGVAVSFANGVLL